ncbi:superoxide dismutase family protein [Flavobacterium sp. SUN046]|jgi:Cu-Zn family superoxide dismutase|uniref:superoxide dismutase family protein n=1 Tax=Flavobacterium sp. SUN046 TaxID=3002440 RepID=UPI002DB6D805|nr:superoxide dismutase family protein [Flavobacterium sp. SUN046]MEC4048628.1 superoxide dismutase family protein [Flavobacterium sp. SUN046]
MKKAVVFSALVVALVLGCKSSSSSQANVVSITLEPKSNSTVAGTATFEDKDGKVSLNVKLTGLKPGIHAIHIHEKSDCSSADAASAGGHWNPTFKKHGKWTDAEHHKGDIGNFTADENGNGSISFKTDEWCIGCGDTTKDIIGKGLIIHQGADDFTTQPTGNAGARVACSAIIK